MIPLHFFLWFHIKTNIYHTNVKDLVDLKNRKSQEILAMKMKKLNVFLKVEKKN